MKNRKTLFVSKGDVMKLQVKTLQVKSSNVLDFPVSAKTLIKYAMPTMLSSLFMNIYSLVDAFFVANWVGTDGLSAVNIVMPFLAVALAVAAMVATGGSALVAKQLGEGKERETKENFFPAVLRGSKHSSLPCGVAEPQPCPPHDGSGRRAISSL